ncbi:macro domain-containing protein [Nocardioides sp. 31GB23]|uniref:type II toxin-antitoxin system antitoxin DNA ADP-ribosyl glycohydrolase DarG n=1 Tax=Nocardioides sp. 31GB23 TaxID=3156065 RepID=UPI0032AE9B33
MIKHTSGNLLRAEAEALVNTVNTEGVMGKGIALQFKKAYPAMYDAYRKAAKSGEIRLGHVQVWPTDQMTGPKYVINFPTKGHWKSRSKLKDIEAGLADLVEVIRKLGIESIAVPPLGCGNGGLDWGDVEPRIVAAFEQVPNVDVLIFAPDGAPAASEIATATKRPEMTAGRAALVELLDRYTLQSFMAPGLIESQKLMYFLQVAGEPLRLKFAANRYGPYADNLRHVLNIVEGHFLSGYGDGSASVAEAEPLAVLPGAAQEAELVLKDSNDTRARIDRVLDLAAGFESAYGLELLATVHWLATHDATADDEALIKQVWEWSSRKARMFTGEHVQAALAALREHDWLTQELTPT